MLNNVPVAVNRMARNVVINHPNTFNCQVFRKAVTRAAPDIVGGIPTLGGLSVISSADEVEFEYTFIGNGFALMAEQFSQSAMMDREDANNGFANEYRFLIESEDAPPLPTAFEPLKNDVFYLVLGNDPATAPKIAYEIVGIETTMNIPPYTKRFVCNRRDDLHVAGF